MNLYRQINIKNFTHDKHILKLPKEIREEIKIVSHVLPFRANNYLTEELIDWSNSDNDPIFHLVFPQRAMLKPHHYDKIRKAISDNNSSEVIAQTANMIRAELNPHPAGQKCLNVPYYNNKPLSGVQHKYRETVLFFPSSGQTCHAFCTFCFRWPQFIGKTSLKFSAKESHELVKYLIVHHEVTDVLFTGGDPMFMNVNVLKKYIAPLLESIHKTNIQTIRIGTKSLSFWPYRYVSDKDSDDILNLFDNIVQKGINLAIMVHFSHPRELSTEIVKEAIKRIRNTGAQIRTQSPILKHINDDADIWSEMWRKQVNLNCIPYYMFMARDTGAKEYFELPISEAYEIFRKSYSSISGICRTVRGPSMSCTPGKVMISGIADLNNEKVFALRFIQARNPEWVAKPFFAKYDKDASWITDLKPAFGEKFFFEDEMEQIYHNKITDCEENKFE